MISNPSLSHIDHIYLILYTNVKNKEEKVIYMAHNIRLRDIFVAKAIKRVRNLFTKWPISILFFLMLQLMVVMSIKFSPLLFLPFFFCFGCVYGWFDDYGGRYGGFNKL